MKRKRKIVLMSLFVFFVTGFLIPHNAQMPVEGATSADYHPETFWYYPWGSSGTHKGIDVFADEGTPLHPSTNGVVLSTGQLGKGGNYILILGPKWRLHYYAHLADITTHAGDFVSKSSAIGTVGSTGNAAGKPPHLHYSIVTMVPYPWRIDSEPQGWKKMFYLNPLDQF